MPVTQLLVAPTAIWTVGSHGPFATPQVGAAFSAYQFTVTPGPGYPTSGGGVIELVVEVSHDGGAAWTLDAKCDHGPGPFKDKDGNPLTSAVWFVSIGVLNPQTNPTVLKTAPTDLYRVTVNVEQACNATIVMQGVP